MVELLQSVRSHFLSIKDSLDLLETLKLLVVPSMIQLLGMSLLKAYRSASEYCLRPIEKNKDGCPHRNVLFPKGTPKFL